jgi:hypothetical protein
LAIAAAAAVAGIAGIVGVGIWMLSDTGVPPSEPTARVTTPAPSPLEPAAPVAGQEPAAREPPPAAADTAAARTDPEVLAHLARTHLRERGFPSLQVTATEDGTVSVRGMVDAGDRGAVERAVREVQGTNDVDASGVRERRTRAELAAAISDALRDAELAHVRVEVDEQGAVTRRCRRRRRGAHRIPSGASEAPSRADPRARGHPGVGRDPPRRGRANRLRRVVRDERPRW